MLAVAKTGFGLEETFSNTSYMPDLRNRTDAFRYDLAGIPQTQAGIMLKKHSAARFEAATSSRISLLTDRRPSYRINNTRRSEATNFMELDQEIATDPEGSRALSKGANSSIGLTRYQFFDNNYPKGNTTAHYTSSGTLSQAGEAQTARTAATSDSKPYQMEGSPKKVEEAQVPASQQMGNKKSSYLFSKQKFSGNTTSNSASNQKNDSKQSILMRPLRRDVNTATIFLQFLKYKSAIDRAKNRKVRSLEISIHHTDSETHPLGLRYHNRVSLNQAVQAAKEKRPAVIRIQDEQMGRVKDKYIFRKFKFEKKQINTELAKERTHKNNRKTLKYESRALKKTVDNDHLAYRKDIKLLLDNRYEFKYERTRNP